MLNWKGAASRGASGAASGAITGSIVPGLGTLAGGVIGGAGGFLSGLFGGGDKADTNAIDPILKSLQDKSADAGTQGKQLSGMGADALAPVLDYFKKVLGNDPSAIMQATQPQRGRVIDQYDTARKSIANFAPRGGGSSEAYAGSYVSEGQDLSALTSQARTEATGQAAQLGTALEGLGLSAQQLQSADLNTIIQAILSKQGLDLIKSGQNKQMAAGLAEGLGTLLGLSLTRGQSSGSGGGTGTVMTGAPFGSGIFGSRIDSGAYSLPKAS